MSESKSKWQVEFNALPPWAQKLVTSLQGLGTTTFGTELPSFLEGKGYQSIQLAIKQGHYTDFCEAVSTAKALSEALTAPWPKPTDLPLHEKMQTDNLVDA